MLDLVAGRDFSGDGVIDVGEVRDGDPCPVCGATDGGILESARGIEMGHIFQLGRKYADALDLQVLDENGKLVTVTMGSYGIGPSRAVAAIAEGTLDELGLSWPRNVAPADVHLVATGKDEEVFAAAERIATELSAAGVEVLYDDRPGKVSPGVKFKDAEMIGVPTIVVVGRDLAERHRRGPRPRLRRARGRRRRVGRRPRGRVVKPDAWLRSLRSKRLETAEGQGWDWPEPGLRVSRRGASALLNQRGLGLIERLPQPARRQVVVRPPAGES